jgi:hypothetical protein
MPAGLSRDASLECPHCEAELSVTDLLGAIPVAKIGKRTGTSADPVVVIRENPSAGADSNRSRHAIDDQEFTIPKPLKTALRSRHRPQPDSPDAPQMPVARSKSTRRRSSFATPQKTGPAEMVKIILGGLLAIPVAQLVLWWVFAADPLKMAPRIYEVVPAIVPPALAPPEDNDETDEDDGNKDMPPEVRILESMNPVKPIE